MEELAQVLVGRRFATAAGPARCAASAASSSTASPAEIHPYDLTVEIAGRAEAWDCKWGARGINADVLNQLDDARRHAADEETAMRVGLVVYRRADELRRPARRSRPRRARGRSS